MFLESWGPNIKLDEGVLSHYRNVHTHCRETQSNLTMEFRTKIGETTLTLKKVTINCACHIRAFRIPIE